MLPDAQPEARETFLEDRSRGKAGIVSLKGMYSDTTHT